MTKAPFQTSTESAPKGPDLSYPNPRDVASECIPIYTSIPSSKEVGVAMAPLSQGTTMACDIDDLHRLLCDVLQPFDVLSEHILSGCDKAVSGSPLLESDTLFYQKFRTPAYILRDALGRRRDLTRWGEKNDISEEDIQHHLMLALDELESRFLSRRRLILSWGWAKSSGTSNESYPKLRVLQKSLNLPPSTGSSLTNEVALEKIINVVQYEGLAESRS
ncbi:hypothetical protein B0T11DRAFT_296974 [Plectosphaerella cucumerina]|uniref:Uncharacterized protein n=1 Tax=Plectosphaerella cucumerina TaxID=40658 RepID=A0A8K0TPS0_9PEZI|nr:hypothetical protein B0T11DRAFT_296974 [Plectosphaerella cucumerina]